MTKKNMSQAEMVVLSVVAEICQTATESGKEMIRLHEDGFVLLDNMTRFDIWLEITGMIDDNMEMEAKYDI